ncbi:MAG: CO dehydrogenase/CO-methylating acetyl-CoA synthase complex subunit beta, partial [Methanimicrococcus sp.]|nr:CO dehydrogenase/CO-methylating acetyl-CoA synthase complex subunit beta [Methanimicrococcus sp.]
GTSVGFQLVRILPQNESKCDSIIGLPLSELTGVQPIGLIINILPKKETESLSISSKDLEGVIEKKIGDFINQISGVTHQQTRDKIEIRVSKKAISNGLTFEEIQDDLKDLILEHFPFIENVFIQIITDPSVVGKELKNALQIYNARDERALSLHDENVPVFYGCRICQIGCPSHVCIITPDHPSVCGTINWFEAGAACISNPDGPVFEIKKGELIDSTAGEYTGVNDAVQIESRGETQSVFLYSLIENPHTTGSSFDIIAFYIPELDGIGLVGRETEGDCVNGVSFEEMSIFTGYGQQISGFSGIGETYLFSEKFLQKEGGWDRVVWISEKLKNRLKQKAKDKKLADRISALPTEKDVKNIKELEQFLKNR